MFEDTWWEKAQTFLVGLWEKAQSAWARMSIRDKVWVGATGLLTGGGLLLGGVMMAGAVFSGLITAGSLIWLISYSDRMTRLCLKYRSYLDWLISFPCLFAPLFMGANLGLMVVFGNLFFSAFLVFMTAAGEEAVVKMIS